MSYFASNHFESNYFASNHFAGANALLDEGGGSSAGTKKKRKRGEGWALEREILEDSLRARFETPAPQETPKPQPKRVEQVGGVELIREAAELESQLKEQESRYLDGKLSRLEFEAEKRQKNQSLEVIFLALALDKRIYYEIIM